MLNSILFIAATGLFLFNQVGKDKVWDDGLAEVATYKAVDFREGGKREFYAYSVIVKENFDPKQLVKSDRPQEIETLEVLKLNWILSIPAGVATHQQMLSFFGEREDLKFVKLTMASHEWCGNTFKSLERRNKKLIFEASSYWDGQAKVQAKLNLNKNTYAYDALPLQLRNLDLESKQTISIELIHSQIGSRANPPKVEKAYINLYGKVGDTYKVELVHEKGKDELHFSTKHPQKIMVEWKKANGAHYELIHHERMDYWNLTQKTDRKRIPRPRNESP